jgi:hypothetical protein
MKFRHPRGVKLALLSGHSTFVGSEWRTLDERYHQAALSAGCHCDQTHIGERAAVKPKASPQAVKQFDEDTALREALIRMVERSGPDDFTNAGMPNLNTLRKEAGFEFDKGKAYEVFNALKRDAGIRSDDDANPETGNSDAGGGDVE